MTKTISLLVFLLFSIGISAQSRTQKPVDIAVFDHTPVLFNPADYPDGLVEKDGLIYLGNGRIVLKKINVPTFKNYTEAEIKITLVSNGDPWDKSGSCFVIPASSKITMMDIAADKAKYPPQDTTKYEQLAGIVSGKDYVPTVELMRFMTPFGVGHFSNNEDSVSKKRRPVYVDGWAENVLWKQDISDLLPLLEGEAYIGVYIDTWTKEGYKIDLQLSFTES
ncbi:MAG: PNGase F N-terminal domain-containing protein, partial [Bacteroidia bacterium]|nr:PNGase F N-terminal domain-containing protein [Bacteroidia bacterium]